MRQKRAYHDQNSSRNAYGISRFTRIENTLQTAVEFHIASSASVVQEDGSKGCQSPLPIEFTNQES